MFRKLCFASLLLSLSQSSSAAIVNFSAVLDGAQATPVAATTATGSASATLDDVSGVFMVTGSFSGLTSPANNAHVHGPAAVGVPAGVLFPLTFSAAQSGTFSGTTTLSPANIANVINGLTYVNIHSGQFGSGEIRGQLLVSAIPEPTSVSLFALPCLALVGYRRRPAVLG